MWVAEGRWRKGHWLEVSRLGVPCRVTEFEVSGHCGWRHEAEQDETGGRLVPTRREHRLPRNRGLARRGQ